MAEEQAIPDGIMREAWDVAYGIYDPVEFKEAHSRVTKLVASALLAAEARGRQKERERCIRVIDCGCDRDRCGCPGNCAKDDIEAIRTEP